VLVLVLHQQFCTRGSTISIFSHACWLETSIREIQQHASRRSSPLSCRLIPCTIPKRCRHHGGQSHPHGMIGADHETSSLGHGLQPLKDDDAKFTKIFSQQKRPPPMGRVRVFHHGFCCVRVSTIGLRYRLRCVFVGRNSHSKMPLVPMPARLKLLHACDQ
jgi:hypothetical protein